MLRVLIYALPIILAVYALVDLVQTDNEEVQGLPKLAWVPVIVLITVIGPARLAGGRPRPPLPRAVPARAGPRRPGGYRTLAPDDDPDFLRGLPTARRSPRRPRTTRPPPVR